MDLPGGVVAPGGKLATPDAELTKLPGFSRNMSQAREQARKLLQEAGVTNLKFQVTTRAVESLVPISIFLADQWRRIGVTAEPLPLPAAQQRASYRSGKYQVAYDSNCIEADEPNFSLLNYVSADVSPLNFAQYDDRLLDELYEKQRAATSDAERIKLIRAFETHLTEKSYAVPLFWWRRLVPLNAAVRGWTMLPSPHLNQDLTDVWFDRSRGY
jgi:peptide/nickel transport system substrate-binding protein